LNPPINEGKKNPIILSYCSHVGLACFPRELPGIPEFAMFPMAWFCFLLCRHQK
jgi:hypothetical protein